MEFHCDIKKILPGRITVLEFKNSDDRLYVYDPEDSDSDGGDKNWICDLINPDEASRSKRENLEKIIDQMGYVSARAQDLKSPVSTFLKFYNSNLQKVYVMRDIEEPCSVIGILKIGRAPVLIRDNACAHYEADATCILDFYIHESKQRQGFGHYLFNAMLKVEKIKPSKLVIDRPSHKILAFLGKHYGLKDPIQQANNFVVFVDIFNDSKKISENSFSTWNSEPFYTSKTARTGHLDDYFSKQHAPIRIYKDGNTYSNQHGSGGIFDAMHTYSKNDADTNHHGSGGVFDAMHTYSKNDAGTLTPVDDATKCSPGKHEQFSSSWNVLGVKPPDYSIN